MCQYAFLQFDTTDQKNNNRPFAAGGFCCGVQVHKEIATVFSLFRSHWLAVVYFLVLCSGSCEPVHEDRSSWGHTNYFLQKDVVLCMGYNIKNARNGKSTLKKAKLPSLTPLV